MYWGPCWVFVAAGVLSLVVVNRLLITGTSLVVTWGLRGTQASVVVAHGLSCPMACGIFWEQESNSSPLHWQVDP